MIKTCTPEYYRTFVRRWCAGNDDSRIDVIGGKGSPRFDRAPNAVTVGVDWLRSQAIPVEAMSDATTKVHPFRAQELARIAEATARKKSRR